MTGDRQRSRTPSVWNTFAVPIVCAAIVIVSIVIGGLSRPPDSQRNYFQIGIRNALDVVGRTPVSQPAPVPAKQ
jgi:hypothetical protein